eukprot:TRINITY_DN4211_c1_g1_i1.p2 TRINITY_DN4211_c1_g1~~TRINITY_DN4211_c1_g1_i1.p2  ORF type:complete len:114 (+),score=1.44 TRINITY_DN4211_c1_g1_i1:141-482(+)
MVSEQVGVEIKNDTILGEQTIFIFFNMLKILDTPPCDLYFSYNGLPKTLHFSHQQVVISNIVSLTLHCSLYNTYVCIDNKKHHILTPQIAVPQKVDGCFVFQNFLIFNPVKKF